MFVFLTILNDVFQTYLESLKKDLGEEGFKMILMLALLSWAGIFIILWLLLRGVFQMPSDPLFYASWFGLTLLTEISFTLLLIGLLNSTFFAANSIRNISFVVTAIYAAVFLGERYSVIQAGAVAVTAAGSLLFFKKGPKSYFKDNKGLFLILFSLLLTPLEYILYKSATLRTGSYYQFLTGRLVMDLVFFTLFFTVISVFWYRKNPFPAMASFAFRPLGVAFIIGTTATELLESWLIFKIPISLFTVLGTLSIPTAYFIGKLKYKEPFNKRYALGAMLIVFGVVLFL